MKRLYGGLLPRKRNMQTLWGACNRIIWKTYVSLYQENKEHEFRLQELAPGE